MRVPRGGFAWVVALALIVALLAGCTRVTSGTPEKAKVQMPAEYSDLRSKNASQLDLLNDPSRALTLTFDVATQWPDQSKWPKEFDPARMLAWGKDPGLGVTALQAKGWTGKGVSVAYVDQPLLMTHQGLKGLDLTYTKIRLTPGQGDTTSMHGPAVTSLLAEPGIGVAPDVKLYFYAHPPWLTDQTTHADALHAVIEQNRKLPAGQKIRVVGFSDGPDTREKNIEAYQQAIKDAEAEGILVVDVAHPFQIYPVAILPYKDRNNPANWGPSHWYKGGKGTGLGVPTGGRTTASGYPERNDSYAYWSDGGLSWAVPYIVGTLALGWQADPDLTNENAVKYLLDSAFDGKSGKAINPEGFVGMVLKYK
jgi:hypothetical protein